MTNYYKLAFTALRILGSVIAIYSILSCGYVLIVTRPSGAIAAALLLALFYLLFGILLFALSKQIAKIVVKGLERE